MKYAEAKVFLPSATFIYKDVTFEQAHEIPMHTYWTEAISPSTGATVQMIGTDFEIPELADKEIKNTVNVDFS
jgi:hypothetical protein